MLYVNSKESTLFSVVNFSDISTSDGDFMHFFHPLPWKIWKGLGMLQNFRTSIGKDDQPSLSWEVKPVECGL